MDMSDLYHRLVLAFGQPSAETDVLVDRRIRAALLADAAVQPPAGAWDRLRKAITDRRLVRRRGMWVLDEPLRDPPESPPTTLSCRQFERALRIYDHSRAQGHSQIREAMWSNWMPSVVALVNW